MIPVVTPEEMAAIDAAASEPVGVLVERAGWAVYRHALDMLGGTYGRRVVVVAGKGNNGADGRSAARRLSQRGVHITITEANAGGASLPRCDLVIDAAYGTGFRGSYDPPRVPAGALVLAVDVPTGVDSLTGAATASVVADATVTFAALKPGLLFADPALVGVVSVADIGLDASGVSAWLVEPGDVVLPQRAWDAHKYASAVLVVAGSVGMTGAASLCAHAALRAGSGYVRLGVPGAVVDDPLEAVSLPLPVSGWVGDALGACDRMRAGAIGPGLGRDASTLADARRFAVDAPIPLVVDGDGLAALSPLGDAPPPWAAARLLTPHGGEFERLSGKPPTDDRLGEVRRIASHAGATVLSKGRVTVVASPEVEVWMSSTGGPALATAGSGDVLTGIAAAFLARGLSPLAAGAFAACVHGLASLQAGHRRRSSTTSWHGLVAGDLPDLLPDVLP